MEGIGNPVRLPFKLRLYSKFSSGPAVSCFSGGRKESTVRTPDEEVKESIAELLEELGPELDLTQNIDRSSNPFGVGAYSRLYTGRIRQDTDHKLKGRAVAIKEYRMQQHNQAVFSELFRVLNPRFMSFPLIIAV